MAAWQFFVNNILTKPQYMIGLIVLIGYLLLRKPWYDTLGGTIKAIVGYMILSTGSGGMIATFKPILYGLNDRFGLNAAVIDPYFGQNAVQAGVDAGDAIVGGNAFSQVMILMAIAFVANIILVRFNRITKLRAVFTTGNVQIQQASTAFWLILFALPVLRDKPTHTLVIMAIVLGLYWAVGSNLLVGYAQNLTDGAGFSIAHQQMFGVALFTYLAEKMHKADEKKGKKGVFSKKIEDISLPGWMSIFNDNMVCTGILMLIFFGTILALLGKDYFVSIEQLKPEASFFFYVLTSCLSFAANLAILQLGVRTFVAELTVSFQGISNAFLPSAVPGVDCAVSYSFGSPNAVTIGFLAGATGQILAILTLILVGSPTIIIAGFIPMFFDNATIAVFANSKGGLKAAILFPFLAGLCQVFGSAFIATHVGLVKYGGYLGMWDWSVLWSGFTLTMEFLGFAGLGLVIIFLVVLPQIQYRRDKEHYFLITEDYEEYKKQKGLI
ncbi:PTS ascorbate transporter subunit IIC [Criibacterium bergeronii]|uniref:Ascorbate-specific PTS system EIIC component n=1 Tax=Criibacterium bergeronii TaxID=1871336 RepID=A0A371IP43_9FIRM|nr:PTS ascorbate transporter subunit IIC [Criibacterium bergeronii]MBS6062468.1 PTS ascorbate transporter subunit IIC [Peptostreptococcaceae bacterium]RDY22216.1 PTS ascorbate transporter subunit IIC [Criibacterium bergeronii]